MVLTRDPIYGRGYGTQAVVQGTDQGVPRCLEDSLEEGVFWRGSQERVRPRTVRKDARGSCGQQQAGHAGPEPHPGSALRCPAGFPLGCTRPARPTLQETPPEQLLLAEHLRMRPLL